MVWRRLVLPGLLALGVWLAAPPLGQIRDWLASHFGSALGPLLWGGFVGVGLGFGAWAVWMAAKERDYPTLRVVLVAATFAWGGLVLGLFRTGQPLVDAVERVHLLVYGAISYAFLWAIHSGGLGYALAGAFTGTALVAVVDELVQWWVAFRVGEVRDVGLNLASGLSGILAGLAHWRGRAAFRPQEARVARRVFAGMLLLLALVTGIFLEAAHLGYLHELPGGVRFRSRFSLEELERLTTHRAERWRKQLPWHRSPWRLEDHYLTEALAHVAHRNVSWKVDDFSAAAREQLILEACFQPLLLLTHPETREPFDWPKERRDAVFFLRRLLEGFPGRAPCFKIRFGQGDGSASGFGLWWGWWHFSPSR